MAQIALEIAILALVGLGIIAAENIWLCLGSFLIAAVLIAIYIKKENLR